MARLAIVFGTLLALLGVGGYLAGGGSSATALIPLFFGLPIALLGALALARPAWTKHAMHVAAALALLGMLGAGSRAVRSIGQYTTEDGGVNLPAVSTTLMTILCAIFLALCVRSFVRARRAAKA